jgi:hypothetical protein
LFLQNVVNLSCNAKPVLEGGNLVNQKCQIHKAGSPQAAAGMFFTTHCESN